VNYVSSHDGLTMRDLVVAQLPGDEAGETDALEAARGRRHRNLLATLLLSMGTPMLVAGDEWGRSQNGHENAYDQDNEISWLDWTRANPCLADFATRLIRLRSVVPWLREDAWPAEGRLRWLKPDGSAFGEGDWTATQAPVCLHGVRGDGEALWLLNPTHSDVSYQLPDTSGGGPWTIAIDSADPAREGPVPTREPWLVGADRIVVLTAGQGDRA
jgi:pullulanase/glycogen debranching enzyme